MSVIQRVYRQRTGRRPWFSR